MGNLNFWEIVNGFCKGAVLCSFFLIVFTQVLGICPVSRGFYIYSAICGILLFISNIVLMCKDNNNPKDKDGWG